MFCECGTGSFKHVDEDPADIVLGRGSPKARRKKRGSKVNPYAKRGLDRFSIVVSELESRRAKILHRVGGSDTGVVMIRFVQSKKGGWAPVVVKLPEEPFKGAKKKHTATSVAPAPPAASVSATPDQASPRDGAKVALAKRVSWGTMRRPSRYWPVVIVLTLVSLAVFGRMFAICLTSIWWYLLPTLGSGCSDGAGVRRTVQKKHASPAQPAKMGSSCGVDEPRSHAKGKRG